MLNTSLRFPDCLRLPYKDEQNGPSMTHSHRAGINRIYTWQLAISVAIEIASTRLSAEIVELSFLRSQRPHTIDNMHFESRINLPGAPLILNNSLEV